jgi:peptide-methionine (S)-S-oxide reductase
MGRLVAKRSADRAQALAGGQSHPYAAPTMTISPNTTPSALGNNAPIASPASHFVHKTAMDAPFPEGCELALFAMGCFWGAERLFWKLPGVISTQVGYAAGRTEHPTYREVCNGDTGHAEVVRVVFDPTRISFAELLTTFWENHNPTQGMRQGNDVGTQYRSAVYWYDDAQRQAIQTSYETYRASLKQAGFGAVTTEMQAVPSFFYAEEYHQQYLAKNPNGYCGIGGTGVSCPRPV